MKFSPETMGSPGPESAGEQDETSSSTEARTELNEAGRLERELEELGNAIDKAVDAKDRKEEARLAGIIGQKHQELQRLNIESKNAEPLAELRSIIEEKRREVDEALAKLDGLRHLPEIQEALDTRTRIRNHYGGKEAAYDWMKKQDELDVLTDALKVFSETEDLAVASKMAYAQSKIAWGESVRFQELSTKPSISQDAADAYSIEFEKYEKLTRRYQKVSGVLLSLKEKYEAGA